MSVQIIMDKQTYEEEQSKPSIEGGINEPTEASATRNDTVGDLCTKELIPEAAAAHSFRDHLPTQVEIDHSKALIAEWENQVEDTTKSVWKVDWDLRKEVDAIENDFKARMRKATNDARAAADKKCRPLKAKLEGLKNKIKKERSFIAPIRKLPVELVTKIITYDLEHHDPNYDMRRRWQIATVCRVWRAIIIGTATFWKEINSRDWDFTEWSLKMLERRMELSGSTSLNVTLDDYTWDNTKNIHIRHFKALVQAGIHRWHSLTVRTWLESDTKSSPLLGTFTGKLSSLRSLIISDDRQRAGQQDAFDPLYALIAETAPPLETFECYRNLLPAGFLETSIFRNLKSLRAVPVVVAEIMSKTNAVMEVCTGTIYPPAEFKAFNLPHTAILDGITLTELSKCGLHRVQNLTISSFRHHSDVHRGGGSYDPKSGDDIYSSNVIPLHFQNLCILWLTGHDKWLLQWMLDARAPNLSHLTVGGSIDEASQSKSIIQEIFVKKNKRIHLTPTHFELQMVLSPASVIHIMDKWSKIVDFSFQCIETFAWNGFVKSMCRKKNPLCPNLRVLRVKRHNTFGRDSINAWYEAATEILRYRKGVYPLEEIWLDESWSESEGLVVIISDV